MIKGERPLALTLINIPTFIPPHACPAEGGIQNDRMMCRGIPRVVGLCLQQMIIAYVETIHELSLLEKEVFYIS